MKKLVLVLLLLCSFSILSAQTQRANWTRTKAEVVKNSLFHSGYVVNMPTTTTMKKNDLEFEISHRFVPPVTEGTDALWGIDGPVNMRLGLAFAVTDDIQVTAGRSNVQDNTDLQVKYKFPDISSTPVPLQFAVNAGLAYNSQVVGDVASSDRKIQYFGQVIVNTMINKKLGVGLAPAYLYNSHIYCPDVHGSFLLPFYVQYYVSPLWSLQAEYVPTVTGWRRWHDSFTFGVELETGGHFFKIFFTNNAVINPSQFLAGADLDPNSFDWRMGFMITRLLDLF